MSGALTNLIAFIVAISVLVGVHEFGHYIVGRCCGMKVLRFSIGFGKPLWTWIAGEDRTEYCVSAIPLGGYVKFLDEREGPVEPADQGRAFNHRPIPARIVVLLAGPAFNFLFALIAYWILSMQGVPTLRPVIGTVEPDSYAAQAGLLPEELLVAVGDQPVDNWGTALLSILDEMIATGLVPLVMQDINGDERTVTIHVGGDRTRLTEPGELLGGLGFMPGQPLAIAEWVEAGAAADRAGMLPGDRIVSVNGESTVTFGELAAVVVELPDKTVPIRIVRDGRQETLYVDIAAVETPEGVVGRIGVSPRYLKQFGAVGAIGESFSRTGRETAFTVRMLWSMVTGQVSIKNISGPISIAQYVGDSARAGFTYLLTILALISISLGVLNLLPIPILDGGQIVYQSVEWIKGSPMSDRAQMLGQQVGILAILLLMSFAFYNDIARMFS
ncbi:MAG: RIP metalloprotease RseP [Woeseiaceae bacterium]